MIKERIKRVPDKGRELKFEPKENQNRNCYIKIKPSEELRGNGLSLMQNIALGRWKFQHTSLGKPGSREFLAT